jgi:CelD/BcsL family acetyltransferase involved in cellulose biosynthesis
MVFERIDINSGLWDEQLNTYPNRTVFQTPAWLSFVARTQDAEPVVAALINGRETLGYFTGLIVRKFGFRILGSPFPGWTTSYMGLCLSKSIPARTAIEALMRLALSTLNSWIEI